jgi:hypothetical protein
MSLTAPNPIIKPFCNSGTQVTPPVGADTFVANQETGFPDSQATPLPVGTEVQQDQMNGIFKFYTSLILWLNSGGQFTFNQAFSDANNGYAKDNILWCESTSTFQRSLVDNNTANFVTNPSYIDDGIHWISMNPLIVANNSARAYYTGNSNNISNPTRTFAYVSEIPLVFADNATRACYTGGGTNISNPARTFAYLSELPNFANYINCKTISLTNPNGELKMHAIWNNATQKWHGTIGGRVYLSINGSDESYYATVFLNNTLGITGGQGDGALSHLTSGLLSPTFPSVFSSSCYLSQNQGLNYLNLDLKFSSAPVSINFIEGYFTVEFTADSIS